MTSYINDIYPLLKDQADCMIARGWMLDRPEFMCDPTGGHGFADHYHARKTYDRLSTDNPLKKMPKGGPFWREDQLALFQSWMEEGFQP